jgi:hypothetical protein
MRNFAVGSIFEAESIHHDVENAQSEADAAVVPQLAIAS